MLAFFRMQTHRDAAPLVLDLHRAVAVDGDDDALAVTRQRFVDGVVDRLLHDVQGVDDMGIHARVLADRFEALERLERRFVVNDLLHSHGIVGTRIKAGADLTMHAR
jgi:hypothetical protein